MSDFLMRMVTRAAGHSSTVVPRLPYQFGYSLTRPHGIPSRPSSFDTGTSSSQTASFGIASLNDTGIDVEAGTIGRAEAESSLEPSLSPHGLLAFDPQGNNVAAIPGRKKTPNMGKARGDALQQPISDQSQVNIPTESEPPNPPAFGPLDVPLDTRRLRIANQPQNRVSAERERLEAAVEESNPDGIEQNTLNVAPATGKATRFMASEPAATLPGWNRLSVATSNQQTPSAQPDPVEVNIGRVEVILENPAPPLPGRPAPPRGFDAYAALRRYSPQAWNRWARNR